MAIFSTGPNGSARPCSARLRSARAESGHLRAGAIGIGLALAVLLSGCGGEDKPAGANSTGPTPSDSQHASNSARPSPSTAVSEGTAAGQGTRSGAELAAALEGLKTDLNMSGTVVEEAQLKASTRQSAEALKGVEYTPCNPTEGTDPTRAVREASMAAMVVPGNAPGVQDSISVLSWPDEEPVADEIEAGRRQLSACPEFTLTANGRTVSSATEAVDMPPLGDASQAYVTRQTVDGATQTSLVLTAWSGTNSAQITLYEVDPQESVRWAAAILEAVLDRIGAGSGLG